MFIRASDPFSDGTPERLGGFDKNPLSRNASHFHKPALITTGRHESETLGSLLLFLAARTNGWHRIPWRMLRNAYLQSSSSERKARSKELSPPELPELTSDDAVVAERTQESKLLVGLKHLLVMEMIVRTETRGETYFAPTERLLASVITPTS